MATYGGSNKNLFPLPSNASDRPVIAKQLSTNKYNVQVNDGTQVAQVYRQGTLVAGGVLGQTGDTSIGTYNLQTKQFTPDPNFKSFVDVNPNSTYSEELKFFGSADGKKLIAGKSAATVQKGVIDNGGTTQQAQNTALKVTGTNAAPTDPNSPAPQATGTQQDLLNNASVKDKDGGWRKEYENLRYPIDRDTKQDYILFTMKRYSPRSFDVAAASSASGNIFGDRDKRTSLGSVSLPIQPNIADSNAVKWGEDSMQSLDALTQGVFTSAVSGNVEQGAENAGGIVTPALGPLKSAGVAELAGRATGTNKSLFTRTTGAVFNPNVELLFEGPSLRGFQFNFSLSAREPGEAIVIKKIIRFFKQGMSVKRAESTLFLKAPNTFDIQYIYGKDNKDHPWINKIKECALQNFTVNYTPSGSSTEVTIKVPL